MKQYNRIMLGEHGMYIADCLENNYIGAGFLKDYDLSNSSYNDEERWRQELVSKYLQVNPDKSAGTARNSIGFLWTIVSMAVNEMVIEYAYEVIRNKKQLKTYKNNNL